MIDECSVNPLTHYLISSRGGGGGDGEGSPVMAKKKGKRGGGHRQPPSEPKLLLTFSSEGANSLLHLTAKPIEVSDSTPISL